MKFYFTFSGNGEPGKEHYMIVNAPCEATAIDRLHAMQLKNWSTVYRHERYPRRAGLTLWRKI